MSAPVKNTCPDIDKIISRINAAIKAAANGRKAHPDADGYFWDIVSELEGLDGKLEDLRRDNAALREWGRSLDEQLHEAAEKLLEIEQ